jgi:hypothetical protein
MIATVGDAHADGARKRYRYSLYPKIAGYVLAPLFAAFFTGLAIFLFEQGAVGVAVLCLLFAIGIVLLIALTSLTYAPIDISDEGIAAYKLGWKMKSTRWQDVKKIQKMRFWNMGARAYQDRFYVYDGDFGTRRKLMVNLRGPIVFTDEIRELRELLDRINGYARRYSFPLVALDQEAASKLAAQKGAGYLGRAAPKTDEVKVTEF